MPLSRPWDTYDAYLFDIDGTLLRCEDAVHYFGFCHALTNAVGRPVDIYGLAVQGKIDPGILREAFARAGVPESEWGPKLPQILDEMAAHVEASAGDFKITVMPGVREILQHLRARGAKLGTGTGNLERIGWAKLQACGLRDCFDFGGFSDSYEVRGEMIAGAAQTARKFAGQNAAILVIGDTPGDVEAARFANLDVLAVATGIYTADELKDADQVTASLQDLL